jgi:hypothetical protein
MNRLEGTMINSELNPASVMFDVDVSMDEERRTNEELTINFRLSISTKPSLVKYEAAGKAYITGGRMAFDTALKMDENTSVPKILIIIYQKVFTALYLLASQLETPYPPPDLIHSPIETQNIGIGDMGPESQFLAEQQAQQTA